MHVIEFFNFARVLICNKKNLIRSDTQIRDWPKMFRVGRDHSNYVIPHHFYVVLIEKQRHYAQM